MAYSEAVHRLVKLVGDSTESGVPLVDKEWYLIPKTGEFEDIFGRVIYERREKNGVGFWVLTPAGAFIYRPLLWGIRSHLAKINRFFASKENKAVELTPWQRGEIEELML